MKNEITLKAIDIEASYFKKKILTGVSIEIQDGEIVSLLGPNGAGKSTLLKVIFGLLKPLNGRIFYSGKNITANTPYQNAKLGIGYFIQGGEVFTNLSVIENLELVNNKDKSAYSFEDHLKEIWELFPELEQKKSKRAGLLSGGERQMLALSILLIQRPKLLLLDEPSAGLAPILVKKLITKIKEINRTYSLPILLVEQNIQQALDISDRVYLMKLGEIVFCNTPGNILKEKSLEQAFFN